MRHTVQTRWNKGYLYLGLFLLAAFLVQDLISLKWPWLVRMQADETFKQLTGLLLVCYIGHQWYLSLFRLKGSTGKARTILTHHKTWGAMAPMFFYTHSHRIGYAYLLLLSSVYFANLVVGLLNQEVMRIQRRWFVTGWMVVHVSLAILLIVLTSYHIFIAFYYQ